MYVQQEGLLQLRHDTYFVLFPQNAVYLLILSLSVQILFSQTMR